MVIDFSKINIKNKPMLILQTNDGVPLSILGNTFDVSLDIRYNEVSTLKFSIPAYVDGIATDSYNDIIGTRIIRFKDVGCFILTNPKIKNDGIKEVKECTAYSLEYEFTHKKISLENATFNFWNSVAQDGTILSIIMEKMPSWSVGHVDTDLIGKYRTFDINNEDLYNFIKSKLQETYQCIFEFDTFNRKVNVRSVNSSVTVEPVYFSLNNLIKEIEIDEDSDNILTCLDVSGAEGVSIRSVNPMGTNKIYDYGYFMNTTNFSQSFIDKYNLWKSTFEDYQLPYYNLTVEHALKVTEMLTEQAVLTDLYGQLKNLENQQAVAVQSIAQGLQSQSALTTINQQISAKISEIEAKKNVVSELENQANVIIEQMIDINKSTAFAKFFTEDELLLLDKYTKEDSLTDSSFAAPEVKTFNTADISDSLTNLTCGITGAKVTKITSSFNKDIYTVVGGLISTSNGIQINADIVRASYEVRSDNKFLFTAYLKSGTISDSSESRFESGCVSFTGSVSSTTSDTVADTTLPSIFYGTKLSFVVASANFYFTQNTTEYEQRSVEWDLYDYGVECLSKLSTPSYSFSVDSANFLALDDFIAFKNKITLGNKIYLRIDEKTLLQPILIGATIDFEQLESFSIEFGNTYKSADNAFALPDLLQQSISMGSKVDFSQYSYNKWVDSGAETAVGQFMKSALDVAKNAILSSSGQAPTLDDSGLRLRRLLENGEYSPKQIWMNNNSIMLTSNNWSGAEIAIGEFVDSNCGSCWGVVAPNIVGTLLAGNNLVIESVKKDGGKAVFRVDGDGAALYNSILDIYNGSNTQITLNPYSCFAIGKYPLYSGSQYTINIDNAKFWVDTDGNLHLKGTLHGVDGTFSGKLEAATGTFAGELKAATGTFSGDISASSGTFRGTIRAADIQDMFGNSMLTNTTDYQIKADYLNLLGLNVANNFIVDKSGNVTIRGKVTLDAGSYINWSSVNSDPTISYAQNTADGAYSAASNAQSTANAAQAAASAVDTALSALKSGLGYTYIDGKNVISPNIRGGTISSETSVRAGRYYNKDGDAYFEVGDSSFGDFTLWGSGNNRVFQVYDDVGSMGLRSYGNRFMTANSAGAYPQGVWDFTNAIVDNLNAVFS